MAYSAGLRERVVQQMFGADRSSVAQLREETGVSLATLSRWRREAVSGGNVGEKSGRRRRKPPKEKIRIVMQAAGLSDEELGAFLRREGLHEADLVRLREEVLEAAERGLSPQKQKTSKPQDTELNRVKKELARKEKALAEAAALLVLRGKLEAYFSEDEDDDMDNKKG